MGKKKGKKEKVSVVGKLLKVTGDLSDDRLNTILFGYDYNNMRPPSEHNVSNHETGTNIVKRRRFIAPQTKHFSDMLEERAASPVVSPRYGLSGEDETAWEPYYGKSKSFRDISKDCKEWSERIRRTLHEIKVKKGETDPKSKQKSTVPKAVQVNQDVVKRIRSNLPDTQNDNEGVVIDLMELSEEMSELRKMLTLEKDELQKMNISAEVVEQMLFESTQLGEHADQVRLLDLEHAAAGFAKNLRGIWELLYLRATGDFLPSTAKEIAEVEELQLRTVNVNFVQPLSNEELERGTVSVDNDDDDDGDEGDEGNVSEDNSALQKSSITDSIESLSFQSPVEEEPTRASAVLEGLIQESNLQIQEPAVVPMKTFNFPTGSMRSSAESLDLQEGLAVGFGEDQEDSVMHAAGDREFENYNKILDRRTTVYDGAPGSGVDEVNQSSSGRLGSGDDVSDKKAIHIHGSFNVVVPEDEIDEHLQSMLTKSSITQIELRYSNSSLYSSEEDNWTYQQKVNKIALLTKIKAGNFFKLKKNRRSLTPDPQRTPTVPRTPLSREFKTRRSKPVPIVDKRTSYKELKHVSVEFGFAEFEGGEVENENFPHGRISSGRTSSGRVSPGRMSPGWLNKQMLLPDCDYVDDGVVLNLPPKLRSRESSSRQESPRLESRQHSRQQSAGLQSRQQSAGLQSRQQSAGVQFRQLSAELQSRQEPAGMTSRQQSAGHQSRQESREESYSKDGTHEEPLPSTHLPDLHDPSNLGIQEELQEVTQNEEEVQEQELPPSSKDTRPSPETIFLSSPRPRDIAASFSPLTAYAQQESARTAFFPPEFERNTIFEKENEDDDDKSVDTRVSYAQAVFHPENPPKSQHGVRTIATTGPSVKVAVTDIVTDAFSAFNQPSSLKTANVSPTKSRGRSRGSQSTAAEQQSPRAKSRSGSGSPTRECRTSPVQTILRTLTRSPAKSPTMGLGRTSPEPLILHSPRAPAKQPIGNVSRPAGNVGVRVNAVNPQDQSRVEKNNCTKGQEVDDANNLDGNSNSTMFSMIVSIPGLETHQPPQYGRTIRTIDDSILTDGPHPYVDAAFLTVSDSFVEKNNEKALKALPPRPIKRGTLSRQRVTESTALPEESSPRDEDTWLRNQDPVNMRTDAAPANKRTLPLDDEILRIVGNVSPRALDDQEHRDRDSNRPTTMPTASTSLHKNTRPSISSSQHQKRLAINKHTLTLSLPIPNLSKQDSNPILAEMSSRFDKPIRRNLSADSISDFNLSMMSMSIAESFSVKDASSKAKTTKSAVNSKYMQPSRIKRSSTVEYSKSKLGIKSDFIMKYPLQVKGVECEEIYYDSMTGHIVISTVSKNREQYSTIDMPIEDVIVTYGSFEGTLTLRCTTNATPTDYVATIRSDDWRRILAQVENGLKRNYAMHKYNMSALTEDIWPTEQPEIVSPVEEKREEDEPKPKSRRCPAPPANSITSLEKKSDINQERSGVKEESTIISTHQSFMDEMVSLAFESHDSGLRGFSSGMNPTTSKPELGFLGGFSTSHLEHMNTSLSSDELNRSSTISKRNGKGAAPLPVIDDNADDNENVFLTGFHLKDNFSIHIEEQNPHEEVIESNDVVEEGKDKEEEVADDEKKEEEELIRKLYRRYPPPMSGHHINDSDALVENIIKKFNDLHPPIGPEHKPLLAKKHELFADPLPRAVTFSDENKLPTQDSSFPLTHKPAMQVENVVEYRQRTAPTKTFVAPNPLKRVPPVNFLEQYAQRVENAPTKRSPRPQPVTYAVLDEDDTIPNPRLVSRGESTYKTLVAKRPTSSSAPTQSFKSPRSGKSLKATSHANVFISNERDENSSLAKMMEVSNQLQASKADMMERIVNKKKNQKDTDKDGDGVLPEACSKIELKLSL